MYRYTASSDTVQRIEDGALIPLADPDGLAQREYAAWLAQGNEPAPFEPSPFNQPAAMERLRSYRVQVLNALAGLLAEAVAEGRADDVNALIVARQGLKDMPTWPAVLAATNDAEFDAACVARYYQLAAALPEYLRNAFVGVV